MLEIINIYAHGYVFIPVVHALKSTPFLSIIKSEKNIDINDFESRFSVNSGYFRAALKMIESVGWISIKDNRLQLIQHDAMMVFFDSVDESLLAPYDSNILRADFDDTHIILIKRWVDIIQKNKQRIETQIERDLLDGPIITPLLIALRKKVGTLAITPTVLSEALPVEVLSAVSALFTLKGWMEQGKLNGTGQFLLERAFNLGMVASYWPMLLNMSELLFGDPDNVFSHDKDGHESHIDRTLNVIASGFQHERFFSNVDLILSHIFDEPDLNNQPKYISDMGCGDGAFLLRVYTFITENTLRGKNLSTHPLLLIGVDLNQKALLQTELTLKDIPHITLLGDVANPNGLVNTLAAKGISDPQNILHIRSFLDHEIPYQGVDNQQAANKRPVKPLDFISITDNGELQKNHNMIQRYVEHFSRWATVMSKYGMLILEVHTLPAKVVKNFFAVNESFYFDAIHSFSRQNLLDACTFTQVAAEAGLFSDSTFFNRFPHAFPYTRVTLNWFRKKPYSLRNATLQDIDALCQLEELCWADGLRIGRDEITRRITENPTGNFVIDYQGDVVGVGYTQRIASEEALYHTNSSQVHLLHRDDAPVLQLLAINIHPEWQQMALGDAMLTHLLRLASLQDAIDKVVGVTRCKNFLLHHNKFSYEQYVNQSGTEKAPVDPILHFHLSHGAHILGIVRHYRPADNENEGHGVLIGYAVRNEIDSTQDGLQAQGEPPKPFSQYADEELAQAITERLKKLLGQKKISGYHPTTSFRDMGLDSLDLTELREVINRLLDTRLDAAIFFRFSTPQSIIEHLNSIKNQSANTAERLSSAPQITEVQNEQSPVAQPKYTTAQYRAGHNDIAIVGIGCRFPQGINSKQALWQLLQTADDIITPVPEDRWDPAITASVKGASFGGFLQDISLFDAAFFGISPREAANMDPQQRLLLETSWQGFEDAGIDPHSLKGSNTGIFIGHFGHDYESLQIKSHNYDDYQAHFSTGSSAAILAGRLSYFYDFHGPAISLNTACSSALVAVHLACKSLLQKECDVALAGAANVILTPELNLTFGRANMLSATGKCNTFDEAADGYVRSEGCAVIVLKRAQDALDAGDHIQAIIKGSAINQDGASNGLTAPNGQAQEAVIKAALTQSGVTPNEIAYVETHGTGTSLGDPVEVEALVNVFTADNAAREYPLSLGSVKTQLGHTEAVAGLAGLIKSVLILNHRLIPPTSSVSTINPLVDRQLQRLSATINKTALAVPEQVAITRVGVSSFGYSGTNAHMILEEAPTPPLLLNTAQPMPSLPFLISAKNSAALQAQAAQLHAFLTAEPAIELLDLAASLAINRCHFSLRATIMTDQRQALLDALASLSQGKMLDSHLQFAQITQPGKLLMLFTGQGSQYASMGYACYQQFPQFRQAFDAVCAQIDPLMAERQQPPLRDIIFAEPGGSRAKLLDQTMFTQPALFALEVALYRLFESWGVKPDLLCGHSIGEVSAAHIAGVLSLQDACVLVTTRARLMQAQPVGGAMVSLQASEEEVQPYLVNLTEQVSIAALNGPRSTVIAGDEAAVLAIAEQFVAQQRRATRLTVSHAFHSPHMAGMLREFRQVLDGLTFHSPKIPIISNLTGKLAEPTLLCSADYWCRHVRSEVRFSDGIRAAEQLGATTFLEIGPQGILTSMAQASLRQEQATIIAPLGQEGNDAATLMSALASLHRCGHTLDWRAALAPWSPKYLELPTYAFQRESYWVEVKEAKTTAMPSSDALRYALQWKTVTDLTAQRLSGHWLLVCPDDEHLTPLVTQLSQALTSHGATVTLQRWENAQPDHVSVTSVLNTLSQHTASSVNVLSLLALNEQPYPHNPLLPSGFALNVQLLHLLDKVDRPLTHWLVTRNTAAVNAAETVKHAIQALNWGLARTAALEYPMRGGGVIDISEHMDATELTQLITILGAPGLENQWVLRGDRRFVPRLRHAALGTQNPRRWHPTGTVLVTGGNGAIAEHLTRWLCSLAAKHIVLISRHSADPQRQKHLAELAPSTTRITFEQCDVADRQALSELLARLEQDGEPISTVFHAAGVMDDQPLHEASLDRLSATLAGKVEGARHLSELLGNRPLDAFVMFSSIAGVWGSGRQSGYSAANAYLDALAVQRRSQGLTATAIAWGMWQGAGMATEKLMQDRVRRYGIRPLSPAKAIEMLHESLNNDVTHHIIADIDWPSFTLYYSQARPSLLFAELAQAQQPQKSDTSVNTLVPPMQHSPLQVQLQALDSRERAAHLLSLVLDNVARVLGFKQSTTLTADVGFFNQGMDSIMAVELRERLQTASGVKLPVTLIFDYPTPLAVAQLLAEKLQALAPPVEPPQAQQPGVAQPTSATTAITKSDLTALDDDALLAAANALLNGENQHGSH